MVSNKHVSKIIIALMAVAVVLCILAVVFSGKLLEQAGGKGVKVEYETKLFDTDQIISIDILMDDDTWKTVPNSTMLQFVRREIRPSRQLPWIRTPTGSV